MAVESAVSTAVEKLSDLAIQKVCFLLSVEEQATRFKDELNTMQRFLEDATEKQFKDKRVRGWISDIRDVAYDTEDVVESFNLRVDTPRRRLGLLGRCVSFPKYVYHLNRLGLEIESIQKRLKGIDEKRERYGIQSLDEARTTSPDRVERRRRVCPWQPDKHVVGFEEHVETLLQKAVHTEKEGLSFVSIVGMGGVGKSTLAKKIYNHASMGERFDLRAWVTVSHCFNPREVLTKLLLELKPRGAEQQRNTENLPEESLQKRVYDCLQGKQYFVVVDDVWEQQDLECIARALPDETERASRLLITSRVHNISRNAEYVHEMKGLDSDQSWEVFQKAAFRENDDGNCPQELEDIGRKIVEKCNGLPLAITVMGGLLLEQGKSVSKWERVLKEIKSHLEAREDSVSAILELSYQDLPPRLKSCFLYLSFFKEDVVIKEDILIALWIAEGIVPQGEGEETMEETAKGYLDELINRNIVQSITLSDDFQDRQCRVHDLLHDLSTSRAKDEINFHILNNDKTSNEYLDKARHLAIRCDNERLISSLDPNPHLRSLLFCASIWAIQPSFWKNLGCCRVLQLECPQLQAVTETIGNLIGLTYLEFSKAKHVELPRSLGNLKKLQLLDVRNIIHVQMPNVIWKLDNLRHLYLPHFMTCEERLRLDTLKNLQTLHNIRTNNIVVDHLVEMVSLRNLVMQLTADVDVKKLLTLLAKLQNLVSIELHPISSVSYSLDGIHKLEHITRLSIYGGLEKLPDRFPKHLSHLKLSSIRLHEDAMLILGKLPNLLHLTLIYTSYAAGEKLVIVDDGFPRLKVLNIFDILEVICLYIERMGLPNLEKLEIRRSPYLSILLEEEETRLMGNFQTCEGNWRRYCRRRELQK